MLTIFAIPKPFRGHIGVIQRNAVRSWLALQPACEVILLGDEEGVEACARDLGAKHIRGIACNEHGTPLLNDAFAQVASVARFPRLCYVNGDIILPTAFTRSVERVRLPTYLMIGQRVTIEVGMELDLTSRPGMRSVERLAVEEGVLDAPFGIDYFVFPKGVLGPLPPFAVGRPGWDNWMLYKARELCVPVVDASESVLVIHQDHSYAHVPQAVGDRWEGPEAEANRNLVSPSTLQFTVRAATWRLTPDGLEKRQWWSKRDRFDLFETAAVLHPWARRPLAWVNFCWRRWDRRFASQVRSLIGPKERSQRGRRQ